MTSLLLALGLIVILGASINLAKAVDPDIYVDPATTIGDLTPAPGSIFQMNVNVSNVPDPGAWAWQFYVNFDPNVLGKPVLPITNMNFTADVSGWTTTTTITSGTATYGYDGADGNSLGSGAGSLYHRATSTAGAVAQISFQSEATFTIPANWVGAPIWVQLSYAYKVTGNSIAATGNNFGIRVQKPDLTYRTLITTTSFTATSPWQYNIVETAATAFDKPGTYKFHLRNSLKTAAVGVTNYVQFNWDDAGLYITPIRVSAGAFLSAGGSTDFLAKRINDTTVYVSNTLVGTPYSTAFPVTGSGRLANISFTIKYGATWLDLAASKLIKLGDPPSYPPLEMTHTATDGFFKNKISGDSNGDGTVNVLDRGYISGHWTGAPGALPYDRRGDNNDDGVFNVLDRGITSANWGRTYVDP